jgi:tRNA (adenine37-N6)-methyltransferase
VGSDSSSLQHAITIQPIGILHSCFTEKFGIPRQPGMVAAASARLQMLPPYNRREMLRGLEEFSHLWIHFLFHQTVAEGWKPTVRPPWLGGKKRVGVFASRSPHRPNHMGLSAVKLEAVVFTGGTIFLDLSGGDFLDQTPVLDIKPYIPYSDCLEFAACGYADGIQPEVPITFSAGALAFCHCYEGETGRNLQQLIREMLHHDPRPASQKKNKNLFGMLLWDVNIRWRVKEGGFQVEECVRIPKNDTSVGGSSRA